LSVPTDQSLSSTQVVLDYRTRPNSRQDRQFLICLVEGPTTSTTRFNLYPSHSRTSLRLRTTTLPRPQHQIRYQWSSFRAGRRPPALLTRTRITGQTRPDMRQFSPRLDGKSHAAHSLPFIFSLSYPCAARKPNQPREEQSDGPVLRCLPLPLLSFPPVGVI
jgi:hypothetical protein